jgi:dihydroflavonol-4-reductase
VRALVTGSTGLLGYALVEDLLRDGHEVRAMVRATSNRSLIDRLEVEQVVGELRDRASLGAAVRGCDWVFSVGALFWSADPQDVYDANVLGTRTFIEESAEAGVRRFVHVNGVTSVGSSPDGRPIDEEHVPNLLHFGNHTEISLFLGYVEMLKAALRGAPVLTTSLTFLIGPNDPIPSPSGQLLVAYLNRRVPGCPTGGLNFVDARDTARALVRAAERGRVGERYIIGNRNMAWREFFDLLAEVTGIPPPRLPLPNVLLLPLGVVSPLVSKYVTHRPPLLRIPRARLTGRCYYYDTSKAARDLGLEFRELRDTLRDAIVWFRDNGFIHNRRSLECVKRL